MKKLSFFAGVSAIALAATTLLPAIGAYAQTATYLTSDEITLTRTVSGVTNPVTNTFTYTMTADSNNPGTVTGMPSPIQIVFNNTAPNGSNVATATSTLDLGNLDYSAVGDYSWTISETGSTDTTNFPLDSDTYTITVSVRYVVDANNVPTGAYEASIKPVTPTWDSEAERTRLEIEADTKGNLADTSLCFEYTINVAGNTNDVYHLDYVSGGGSDCTNPSQITANTDTVIRLKHGDGILVGNIGGNYELPVGASYTISKNDTNDGYTNTINSQSNSYTGTAQSGGERVSIVNTKEADPVTGIVTSAWFYIILLSIGAFGLFFFIIARRRNDDEEQQAE